MSFVESLQYDALWSKRARETLMGLRIAKDAPRDRPRDKWAIATLARTSLVGALVDAAYRYAALVEKTHVRRSCAVLEHVSGGRADPHAAMLRAIEASEALGAASAHVRAHCETDHVRVFDLAFSTPHLSMSEMKRRLGRRGGAGYAFIVKALEATLTRLAVFWLLLPEPSVLEGEARGEARGEGWESPTIFPAPHASARAKLSLLPESFERAAAKIARGMYESTMRIIEVRSDGLFSSAFAS